MIQSQEMEAHVNMQNYFKIILSIIGMILSATQIAKGQTFEDFLQISKKLNWKIQEVECYILLEKNDSIPQEAVIIPIGLENMNDSFSEKSLKGVHGTIIYFQALRWLNPDLEMQLRFAPGIEGRVKGNIWFKEEAEVKILRGTMFFNITYLPEILLHPMEDILSVTIQNVCTELSIADAKQEIGFPQYFKLK